MSALFFDNTITFSDLPLDGLIFKALARKQYIYPSLIQSKVIPLALQGSDILCKAATGAGKTLAYAIPVIQNILTQLQAKVQSNNNNNYTNNSNNIAGIKAIILVPSKELCEQVRGTFEPLLYYCNDLISMYALTADKPKSVQIPALKELPDILISTPTRLIEYLKSGVIEIKNSLSMLVIDEADLLLSYGYSDEIRSLLDYAPKLIQCLLMSATLTTEIEQLKSLVLHNPSIVKLEDDDINNNPNNNLLQQYYINISEKDKYLLVYSLLKLNLLKGKCLFYTNSNETSFRLKLFLELFSISSAVLNSNLPYNSRKNILNQFNRGVFDYLIATDEATEYDENADDNDDSDVNIIHKLPQVVVEDDVKIKEEEEEDEEKSTNQSNQSENSDNEEEDNNGEDNDSNDEDGMDDNDNENHSDSENNEPEQEDKDDTNESKKSNNKKKKPTIKSEFVSSRGLDFQDVSTVINFDLPNTYKCYTHRIGRTARGGKSGTALSLVNSDQQPILQLIIQSQLNELSKLNLHATPELKYLPFNIQDIEGFRYRVEDVSRGVTKASIREAMLKDIKLELINSAKLKAHFEDNPRELDLLKHDKVLRPKKIQKHLKHIPDYLIPTGLNNNNVNHNKKSKRKRDAYNHKIKQNNNSNNSNNELAKKKQKNQQDPLKSFNYTNNNNNNNNKPSQPLPPTSQTGMGLYSKSRVGIKDSTAGRRQWKLKHKTGKGTQKKHRSKGLL